MFQQIHYEYNLNQHKNKQYQIALFSLKENLKFQQFNVTESEINSISFSFNCKFLAVASGTQIKVWDVNDGNQIFNPLLDEHYVKMISFYQNFNDKIISISLEGKQISKYHYKFWNLRQGSFISLSINFPMIQISECGSLMIQDSWSSIRLHQIDPINYKFNICYIDYIQGSQSAFFCEKEELLVLVRRDGLILIWGVKNNRKQRQLQFKIDGIIKSFINSQILIQSSKTLYLITLKKNFEKIQYYNVLYNFTNASIASEGQILVLYQTQLLSIKKEKFQILQRCYFQNVIEQLVILSNGNMYTKEGEKIKLYDMQQNKKIEEINCCLDTIFSISLDEEFFVIAQQGRISFVETQLINMYSDSFQFDTHDNEIIQVAISPNKIFLATMCKESWIKIWNISDQKNPTFKAIFKDQTYQGFKQLEFSYDSIYLARMFEQQIIIVDTNNCQQPKEQKIINRLILGLGSYKQQIEKITLLFVDQQCVFFFDELEKEEKIINYTSQPQSFVFSHDCFSFALFDVEGVFSLYLIQDLKSEITPSIQVLSKKEYFNCLEFSFDGLLILSGGLDRSIRLWNSRDLKQLTSLEDLSNSITALAFSPDGFQFSAGFLDGSVGLYIINNFLTQVTKKQKILLTSLGEQLKIGCLKIFSKHSLLQAQQCGFQGRKQLESDDKSLETLLSQKA